MVEGHKPENLVEQVFLKIIKHLKVPDNQLISQARVKIYDVFKDKAYRYPDFKLLKHRKSDKNLLIDPIIFYYY